MPDQDIRNARERVQALRQQVRAEQNERAVAASESAKESRLSALSAEERHLEAQLEEIRNTQMPGQGPEGVVPAEPGEGRVNVEGETLRLDEPPPEGGFIEEVDVYGNLVRKPLPPEESPATDPATGEPVPAETAPTAPTKES